MKNNDFKTLPVGLFAFKGQHMMKYGPMFAVFIIAIIPTIIFYFIFHRNIVKGVTAGAIKG